MLSVVAWDGEGDGTNWSDPVNWSSDALPGDTDDVLVEAGYPNIVTSGNVSIKSITSESPLEISGGSFSVAELSTLVDLAMSNGTLTGAGVVTVTDTLDWSGGRMDGAGTTTVAAGAVGTISGTSDKELARTLANAGTINYTGTQFEFGPFKNAISTVDNLATGQFNVTGEGDLNENYSASGPHAFHNAGTFTRSGEGTTSLSDVAFNNSGTVEVNSGTLELDGGGTSEGSFSIDAGAALRLIGYFTPYQFNPGSTVRGPGRVVFDNVGNPTAWQTFEALSRDVGIAPLDFTRGSALGGLFVENGSYVQLVDLSDDSTGTGAEAIYTDGLHVSSGSTLDLNSLHVYANAVGVEGTLLGGTATQLPDGGEVTINTSRSGAIAVESEVDEWSFYGRAGEARTIIVNPGTAGPEAPMQPSLD